jgi:dipeptidyl-peptidase-4
MKKKILINVFCVLISVPLIGQTKITKAPLTVDLIWGTRTFFEEQPLDILQLQDNKHYLTLENSYREINKYQFKPSIQKVSTLVSASNLNLEYIDEYKISPNEQQLLIVGNSQQIFRHSAVSDIFIYNINTKKSVEIAPNLKGKRDYSFSPDGRFVVYSHKNNLYQYNIELNTNKQLTFNGKENEIINGTADWVYEEEFSQTKYYDVSFDGRYVAYVSFEQFDVPPVILSYYKNESYPQYETLKYPKVGEKNSVVKLHIIDMKLSVGQKVASTTIPIGKYEYIPRLQFSTKNNTLIVQTMNRKQDVLRFSKVECSNDGKFTVTKIDEETNDKYIEVEDRLYFLPTENAFITLSDRDGYKQIYKINLDGTKTRLTKEKNDIKEIAGITPDNRILYTIAPLNTPYNSAIYSVSLQGDNEKPLTEADKIYAISSYTSGCDYYYGYFTTANQPKTIGFFNLESQMLSMQEDNTALKTRLSAYDLSPKVFTKIKGAVDSLNASIIYPTNFDATKKYPVYFNVYCGPGSNTVMNSYGSLEAAFHQLLAQKGYFVISVDTRGTLYRGADFKKQTYGKLGELELEDLVAVSKELSKWNFIDKDRIGIQGWSYGGFMSSLAITKAADVFKMAIAIAPVTNWKFYDNVYTERYMNLMENNASGYETTSPIYYADKLKGKFLLIHGDADDNVHVQNSMELVNKLTILNKDFDYFVYPNKNHGIGGVRKHLFTKILNFTLNNL